MARRKDIYHAHWTGETVGVGDDTLLFLQLDEDPDRVVMMAVTPTVARRLTPKLTRVLTASTPTPKRATKRVLDAQAQFYGYED